MHTPEPRERVADALWSAYASLPTRELRERLIALHTPIALMALTLLGLSRDEDLRQVALIGLVKAVDRYDPARGCRFSSFAMPTIQGEIKRYLRDHHPVHYPRAMLNLRAAVVARERELTVQIGRAPTISEIADALGVEVEVVMEAQAMDEICYPRSLDGLTDSFEDGRPLRLEESLGAEDPELERREVQIALGQVMDELDPLLKTVLELRFFESLSQAQVAQRLGVSQMQISRLERRALDELRADDRVNWS